MADLRKGYWVHLLPAERCDGTLAIHVLARRTYKIAKDDVELQPLPDEEQPPFLDQDRCDEGKPDVAPPTLEAELVPEKAHVDVIVIGKTYAPGGKAQSAWQCGVRIGDRKRQLHILGPRKLLYTPAKKAKDNQFEPQPPRFSEPEPIKDLPLSLTLAYGGTTWAVPDDEVLKLQRAVQAQMDEEKKQDDAKNADAEAARKAEEEKKAKEAKDKELFESLGEAARRKNKEKDEKLKFGDGSEGFDDEGVRLWDKAASKDGTAVLNLEELDEQRLADMARAIREKQQADDLAAQLAAEGKQDGNRRLRQNALGDWIEVDDQVAILDDAQLSKELEQSAAEQAQRHEELAKAARKRAREAVQQNDGTQVLDAMPEDDEPVPVQWDVNLRQEIGADDLRNKDRREKLAAEKKKKENEALAEFPQLTCPTNPFGRGFLISNHPAVIARTELPQIEDPLVPLTPGDVVRDVMALDKVPLPAGFSTYPRQAQPRVGYAGPMPSALGLWPAQIDAYKRSLDLEKPDDVRQLRELDKQSPPQGMRPAYFNSATPVMQWPEVVGDEEVQLSNLTKNGELLFRLPGRVLQGELDRGRGVERRDMPLDTVVVEVEAGLVTLLWRTHFPLESWEEIGSYPHMVGWVLDLDVQQKRDLDWAARLKQAQGEGTAVLDISNLDKELARMAALGATAAPVTADEPVAIGEHTQALDLEKMGQYRLVEDDDWVKKASDGTVDVSAEERKRKEEEAYVAKKMAAIKALEDQEKKEEDRRQEVAKAVTEGKPIPPRDAVGADGKPLKMPPPPPPGKAPAKPAPAKQAKSGPEKSGNAKK